MIAARDSLIRAEPSRAEPSRAEPNAFVSGLTGRLPGRSATSGFLRSWLLSLCLFSGTAAWAIPEQPGPLPEAKVVQAQEPTTHSLPPVSATASQNVPSTPEVDKPPTPSISDAPKKDVVDVGDIVGWCYTIVDIVVSLATGQPLEAYFGWLIVLLSFLLGRRSLHAWLFGRWPSPMAHATTAAHS